MNFEENKENQQKTDCPFCGAKFLYKVALGKHIQNDCRPEKKMYVAIKTVDNVIYPVEWELARQSPTIRRMVDDLNITKGLTWEEIFSRDFIGNTLHLTNEWMTGPFFRKAIMWIFYKDNPDFQGDEKDEWEKSYLSDMTIFADMLRLLIVANLLEIEGLVNLIKTTTYVPKKYLIIKTVDKEIFHVELESARQSQTIRNMLDDLDITKGPTLEEILDPGFINDTGNTLHLTNEEITGPLFKKALTWMEKNRGRPDFQPDNNKDLSKKQEIIHWDQLDQWEKLYVADMLVDVDDMLRLLIVANFLEIKGLVDLMTTAIALQIQGQTVEHIRETFKVKDPKYTKKELEELNEENPFPKLELHGRLME